MTSPAVSVLMGVWNGAPRVREAVSSVLGQTLTDLELIVIDDGSADGTPAILDSFGDPRLRIERRARGGGGARGSRRPRLAGGRATFG